MLTRLLCRTLLLLAAPGSALADSAFSVYLRHSSTFFSEPAPLELIVDELEGGEFPGDGENAVTFNRFDMGFSYRDFELGWFAREDYAFHFTSDTFKFIYMDKNGLDFADNTHMDIDLHVQHLKLQGLRLGYRLSPTAWSEVSVALNYFEATDILFGRISGHLSLEDDRVGGDLDAAYFSEKDYLLKAPLTAPDPARGHSVDLAIHLALPFSLSLDLTGYDLMGRIRWRNAPYTEVAVSSSTLYYDDAGRLRRAPVMAGMKTYRDVEQSMPNHWRLDLSRPLGKQVELAYTAERYEEVLFNRVFLHYSPIQPLTLVAGYDTTASATWLGMRVGQFRLDLAADDFDLSQSRALMLNASGHWRF